MKLSELPQEAKQQFINQVVGASKQTLLEHIIEKDWWVTQVM